MTLLGRSETAPGPDAVDGSKPPRTADATTFLAIFAALQFVLPSKLVMSGLPLSLSAASLVALGLGTLWLCTQLTTTLGAAKGRNLVRTALFAYAVALLASYFNAASTYLPADERKIGDHSMVTVFALVFVAIAACDGIRSRERIYFLVRTIVICGSAVAVVGILQFLFNYDLTPHLRPPGMHFTSTDPIVLDRSGLRRVSGTTAHPIEFGVFCAMLLPLAIHTAFQAAGTGRRARFWWVCVGLLGMGLMFSVSRSAILGITASGLVLFVGWSAQRRLRMVIAGFVFLVVIKVVSPGLLGTFFGLFKDAGQDNSIQWRTHDYATAKALISEHLWLGRGIGTWYAPKHEIFDNQYLLTLVDSGVIGLVAFLAIVVTAIVAAVRVGLLCYRFPERVGAPARDTDLALAIAASLIAVFPTYATFDLGAFATVASLMYLLVGISAALLRIVSAEVAGEPADPYAII